MRPCKRWRLRFGEFGWQQPIVVDGEGVIIAGHTRLLAAKHLGLTEVPVHVAAGLTPAQVKAYRLMDNRSHEESGWDYEKLSAELFDLDALDIDMKLTGFGDDELADLMTPKTAGLTHEDEVPEAPAERVAYAGDLWILGKHRLLCGDSPRTKWSMSLGFRGRQSNTRLWKRSISNPWTG
jgi:ParB-like chromosome segregation protein Spo0J